MHGKDADKSKFREESEFSVLIIDEVVVGLALCLELLFGEVLVGEGEASKTSPAEILADDFAGNPILFFFVDIDMAPIFVEGRSAIFNKELGGTLYEDADKIFILVLYSNRRVLTN